MTLPTSKSRHVLLIAVVAVLFCSVAKFGVTAQEKHFPQTAGVDDSKMGPYRALAQLTYAASQKGDNALAAKLGRILERTWDKAEDYGGETALSKTNKALFDDIDKSMDHFISPLVAHPAATPDAAATKAAFNAYMEKLKQAD
ncbi:MAG TPA: hypothetical protein VIM00_01510 [Candidatus Acidoferrum sp.]|jgi:hypothetical protein